MPQHRGPGTRCSRRGILLLLALLLVTVWSIPAAVEASGTPVYPTLDRGSRGEDVYALQYLLRYRGYSLTVDGIFGSGTEAKVKAFQSSRGLSADGVVGPATWSKLIATVSWESYGDHVRAVQRLLRYKVGYTNVPINGNGNDAATKQRIRDFQNHMGLTADGVVGPVTWKNLLWHFDKVDPDSYICWKNPTSAVDPWGTAEVRRFLFLTGYSFSIQAAGKVAIGDLSLEHGGDISGHASHEVGLDADIRPIRTDRKQCTNAVSVGDAQYDRTKTRELIYDIHGRADNGQHLQFIIFNDSVLAREFSYVQQGNSTHNNHLHVRYCQVYYPYDSRYDC